MHPTGRNEWRPYAHPFFPPVSPHCASLKCIDPWGRPKPLRIEGGNQKVESIEASGKSVDEAVMQALSRLGQRRDEAAITVLQAPTHPTFGIASQYSRV